MTVTFASLSDTPFDAIHGAFLEAFSDYAVKLSPTREQLAEMLRRRGWNREASIGGFDQAKLVAFTLNGVQGDSAYDSGTGVVPSHRRQGLARALMEESEARLRGAGCSSYLLEVLEANRAAAELYLACGFRETRRLQCWTLALDQPQERIPAGTMHPEWCDVEPSWQNSAASIARAGERQLILGDDDGYAVLFPANGDLPQLAVRPAARRRGIGTRLLRGAAAAAEVPLRIINVDDHDPGIARFLESAGALRTVRQIEMRKAL